MAPPRALQPEFGKVLRGFRLKAGLSQEGLAALARVDTTYVSLLERGGRQPTLAVIHALAIALGKRAYELVKAAEEVDLA